VVLIASAMKRAGNFGGEPEAKVQKDVPEGQGEPWTCNHCQNVNWPLRTTCNNKKCGAPGPWTCPSCGNKNFQNRMACNRKSCGIPRPAHLGGSPMPSFVQMPMGGGYGQQVAYAMPRMAQGRMMPTPVMMPAGGSAPDGSWTCRQCQNVNWPLRTVCNKKDCGALGPWECPSCGNANFQGREVCNRKTCGLPRPAEVSAPSAYSGSAARVPMQAVPVMMPISMAGKGMAKGGGGGMAKGGWQVSSGGGGGGNGGAPPGSWSCGSCGNLNWPLRTVCNNKSCGLPKP